MAKKLIETPADAIDGIYPEVAGASTIEPAEAEVTLIVTTVDAPPEVRFTLKPGLGEVSQTLGSKTFEFTAGETYGCTRAEWFGLAGTGCFDLVE
jgi:hypothetical protein